MIVEADSPKTQLTRLGDIEVTPLMPKEALADISSGGVVVVDRDTRPLTPRQAIVRGLTRSSSTDTGIRQGLSVSP